MTRTLVTGGAGRLGRSVVRALAESGREVVSVDLAVAADLPALQVQADLADRAERDAVFARHRPDEVVHLAAIPFPGAAPDDETFAVNTGLAFGVLDAALASGTRALLVASSPTVIGYGAPAGWTPEYLPLDEAHPTRPWNGYALSKLAIEQLMAMAARSGDDRLRTGAFRPCYVIAPEEWEGAPTQQGHTVRERLERPELSAVALFNYVDARDAGEFVVAWLDAGDSVPSGETFFVGAPDALVRDRVSEAVSEWLPAAASAATVLGDTEALFSSAKAEQMLGWRARRTWREQMAEVDVV